jgi:hypothetical protein
MYVWSFSSLNSPPHTSYVHRYSYMIADVRALQTRLETDSQELVNAITARYNDQYHQQNVQANKKTKYLRTREYIEEPSAMLLSEVSEDLGANAVRARDAFKSLASDLLFKYADGFVNTWSGESFHSAAAGYPGWWVQEVQETDGPCCEP